MAQAEHSPKFKNCYSNHIPHVLMCIVPTQRTFGGSVIPRLKEILLPRASLPLAAMFDRICCAPSCGCHQSSSSRHMRSSGQQCLSGNPSVSWSRSRCAFEPPFLRDLLYRVHTHRSRLVACARSCLPPQNEKEAKLERGGSSRTRSTT